MTPIEVMVYNLCDKQEIREEIFKEVSAEIERPGKTHIDKFEVCLNALKRRGLIFF